MDPRERRDRGLLALGIVGASLSGASIVGGIMYTWATEERDDITDKWQPAPFVLFFGLGAVGLTGSLALLIYGAQKVPAEPAIPRVSVSPTGGSLTWQF